MYSYYEVLATFILSLMIQYLYFVCCDFCFVSMLPVPPPAQETTCWSRIYAGDKRRALRDNYYVALRLTHKSRCWDTVNRAF